MTQDYIRDFGTHGEYQAQISDADGSVLFFLHTGRAAYQIFTREEALSILDFLQAHEDVLRRVEKV